MPFVYSVLDLGRPSSSGRGGAQRRRSNSTRALFYRHRRQVVVGLKGQPTARAGRQAWRRDLVTAQMQLSARS